MQSRSRIQTTGPNNGHQLRDYSKSSNRSANHPLILKIMQWVLAATLVCGTSVFTSCTSDDDNAVTNPDEPQQQLADYTIIYYGHGGGNLDFWLLQNIAQLYQSDTESRKNVSICAQYKFSTLRGMQDGERTGEGTPWGSTLDATYGQLRFDQITGWSRWLKQNQQEPNLECVVEPYTSIWSGK